MADAKKEKKLPPIVEIPPKEGDEARFELHFLVTSEKLTIGYMKVKIKRPKPEAKNKIIAVAKNMKEWNGSSFSAINCTRYNDPAFKSLSKAFQDALFSAGLLRRRTVAGQPAAEELTTLKLNVNIQMLKMPRRTKPWKRKLAAKK